METKRNRRVRCMQLLANRSANLNNMVCVKLHAHAETDLVGAIWVVAENSSVRLRPDLGNLNPHPLSVRLVIQLNTKNKFGQVASPQTLTLRLRRNLKRIRELFVRLCAVVECVSYGRRVRTRLPT